MSTQPRSALPAGPLVAWYGDDFTGASAVAEVLTFAGLSSVLFLDVPTPERLARFADRRGIGIAGVARSKSPEWMESALPPVFEALRRVGAPIVHYKICSTLDSSPTVGSIGKAIDIGGPIVGGAWHPLVVAAPEIRRYQAFGNLFAAVDGVAWRLDRHPTMSRHPVTPMDEADVRLHLARQTRQAIGLVDLAAMKAGRADAALDAEIGAGRHVVALDVVDDETLREAGRLVWERRGSRLFAVGSQGLEYALVAHWRTAGLLPEDAPAPAPLETRRIAVVSGSCSLVTAEQIAWAEDHGFRVVRADAAEAVDEGAWEAEIARAAEAALRLAGQGYDPIVATARGPEDPAIARLGDAIRATGQSPEAVNARIGAGLGRALRTILREAGLGRAVIAGGDTSGYGALELGLYALTALAPVAPGAALFTAHSDDPAHDGLQIVLKGGQMGDADFFGRVRRGGGANDIDHS